MEINLVLKGEAKLDMPWDEIIDQVNQMPIAERFPFVIKFLKQILLSDIQDLTKEQWIKLDIILANYKEVLQNYKKQ